jgi:hypothetical protein
MSPWAAYAVRTALTSTLSGITQVLGRRQPPES